MKNILILNRRCTQHPHKGGAEDYTFELAKALIEQGAVVEWFSSRSKDLKRNEEIEGLKFIRKGNELTTHFYGFLYALKKNKDWLIIDEFNGIGFFTSFFKNSFLLIFQLYNEFWTAEFGLLGHPFKFLEKFLLRLYKKKPTITISPSTYEDLRKLGFKDITIIYSGVDISLPVNISDKEKNLTLIFLGRLKYTKKPEDAIKAFLLVRQVIHDAKLWIVGEGPLKKSLINQYRKIEGIHFWGFVNDHAKYELLKKAHVLLAPSIREGWGLAVLQANAVGTPAVGFNVRGLQDSIRDGITGLLVEDYKEMALRAIDLWRNQNRYGAFCINAFEWAKSFPWEKTKKKFISYMVERGIQ